MVECNEDMVRQFYERDLCVNDEEQKLPLNLQDLTIKDHTLDHHEVLLVCDQLNGSILNKICIGFSSLWSQMERARAEKRMFLVCR